MKRKTMLAGVWVVLLVFGVSLEARADIKPRAAGIGVRGTYWHANNTGSELVISTNQGVSQVNVGGAGGWVYFFSRIDNEWLFEFSLGAIGKAQTQETYYNGEDVKVNAVIPVLFGLRHELFSIYSRSALQPYIAFGAGPYWLNDVSVHKRYDEINDEVRVNTKLKPGGYAGGGMNFMFSSWLGLNFDIKYHFVDFNVKHDYSGWEYGFGLFFTWGRYRPSRH